MDKDRKIRLAKAFIYTLITVVMVYTLNRSWQIKGFPIPAFGKFVYPAKGFWQNADPKSLSFNLDLKSQKLQDKVDVYLDERLVPHVFSKNEPDAYFVQGFLHAKFRLWQMELQTHFAAGRAAEIVGNSALEHDREFRRLGMVFAAENSLRQIEADPNSKMMCDAYTNGVNAFIETLTDASLPMEYKLFNYKPEPWNNLKTALFLKYMSYDLAGYEDDFEMTNMKNYFSKEDFDLLFPQIQDSLDPVIPKGSTFPPQKIKPVKPANFDSSYGNGKFIANITHRKPNRANGSNNWAVSGKKTKSGAPILSSDPHLGLNLPSLWFEMQITIADKNVYGASFPGSPGILIGFNDSCAFGFTNGGRDVRDYYDIKFKSEARNEYWYNNTWLKTKWRIETIKVKGKPALVDSVPYVQLGKYLCPVMYDKNFKGQKDIGNKSYAVLWKGHEDSNELLMFYKLNRASNYGDYTEAMKLLRTPGQNGVFACKNGDIAIRTQGDYPAKWIDQGDYIMPGTDSSYLWQGSIPQDEVPLQYNPERGFVSSANQKSADDHIYPYYLGRNYPVMRGKIINRYLTGMSGITPQDMMTMQTDNYNLFAEYARPILLKYVNEGALSKESRLALNTLRSWNLKNDIGEKGPVIFDLVWSKLYDLVFNDEYEKAPTVNAYPMENTLLEALLKNPEYKFVNNINTPEAETLNTLVTNAFLALDKKLEKLGKSGRLEWGKFKGTHIDHLTRIPALSKQNVPIGGGNTCINACVGHHGPSWRMVVSLTKETEAYGIYPGGQNGNPGSFYYDNFISDWAKGTYYRLWVMKPNEKSDKRIKWTMSFSNK